MVGMGRFAVSANLPKNHSQLGFIGKVFGFFMNPGHVGVILPDLHILREKAIHIRSALVHLAEVLPLLAELIQVNGGVDTAIAPVRNPREKTERLAFSFSRNTRAARPHKPGI